MLRQHQFYSANLVSFSLYFVYIISVHVCVRYLDGGGGHLSSLVKVEGHYVGEPAGVSVHRGGAVAESLQDGVDRLPLLSCVTKKK